MEVEVNSGTSRAPPPMAKERSSLLFGWFGFRPEWLQFLNTPRWFLFFLCQYFFMLNVAVNGIYPGALSTIERRFGFTRYVSRLTLGTEYIHSTSPFPTTVQTAAELEGFLSLFLLRQGRRAFQKLSCLYLGNSDYAIKKERVLSVVSPRKKRDN